MKLGLSRKNKLLISYSKILHKFMEVIEDFFWGGGGGAVEYVNCLKFYCRYRKECGWAINLQKRRGKLNEIKLT